MNVLGINSVYHESAAALLVDGTLVAAVEEERFNRIKHGKSAEFDNPHQLPERAIRFCLNYAGLTAGDIDHVAYSFDPKLRRTRYRAEWWDPRLEETFRLRLGQVRGAIEELLGRSLGQRFHFVPHHLAHAASAYFPSGFDRAAILSIDGIGESGRLFAGEGRRNAYPVRRNVRVSTLDWLPVGGDQRLSWLLALRRFEGHGLGGLRQSRGLPSANF